MATRLRLAAIFLICSCFQATRPRSKVQSISKSVFEKMVATGGGVAHESNLVSLHLAIDDLFRRTSNATELVVMSLSNRKGYLTLLENWLCSFRVGVSPDVPLLIAYIEGTSNLGNDKLDDMDDPQLYNLTKGLPAEKLQNYIHEAGFQNVQVWDAANLFSKHQLRTSSGEVSDRVTLSLKWRMAEIALAHSQVEAVLLSDVDVACSRAGQTNFLQSLIAHKPPIDFACAPDVLDGEVTKEVNTGFCFIRKNEENVGFLRKYIEKISLQGNNVEDQDVFNYMQDTEQGPSSFKLLPTEVVETADRTWNRSVKCLHFASLFWERSGRDNIFSSERWAVNLKFPDYDNFSFNFHCRQHQLFT